MRSTGPETAVSILMSEATRRFVQEEVWVEAYDALAGANLPQSLPVYKVRAVLVRRAGVPGRSGRLLSPFVGRARELAFLQALLAQVEAGQGQVVGIVGEPGIGKSRLLYEFAQALRDMGVGNLEGHCFAYDQATPYGPVRGMLRQRCGMTDADSPEAMITKLRQGLREVGLRSDADAPYLLALLGVPEDTASLAYAWAGRVADTAPLREYTPRRTSEVLRYSEAYLLVGRVAESRQLSQRALAYARDHQEQGYQAQALWLLGESTIHGDPPEIEQAAVHYRQALALADALGMRPLQAHCYRGLGMLYGQTGQWEQARAALATAVDRYRAMDMTFWLPLTEAALAHVEGR